VEQTDRPINCRSLCSNKLRGKTEKNHTPHFAEPLFLITPFLVRLNIQRISPLYPPISPAWFAWFLGCEKGCYKGGVSPGSPFSGSCQAISAWGSYLKQSCMLSSFRSEKTALPNLVNYIIFCYGKSSFLSSVNQRTKWAMFNSKL
jgi:hypothetical protein